MTSTMTTRRPTTSVLAVACLLALGACVVEREGPSRGLASRPTAGATSIGNLSDSLAARPPAGPAASLPAGPVATPVPGQPLNSHVVIEVKPLGSVGYDGQVLPLVSPDGRLLAVQEGEAPPWPALLAAPEAQPLTSSRLGVYDLAGDSLSRVDLPELPPGLMLGRGADDRGFLVECPRVDASRWIGRVAWASGRVEWLAQGGVVNAHALLTPAGDLLYTRREIGSDHAALVLRRADGTESVRIEPDASYEMPLVSESGQFAFAFLRLPDRLDVEAIRLSEESPGRWRLGATTSRRQVVRTTDPAMPYQLAVGAPGPLPLRAESSAPAPDDRGAFFHPLLKRMALLDPRSGELTLLPPESFATVHWPGLQGGYFSTTPSDLVFSPDLPQGAPADRRADARVLATPLVARRTLDPLRHLIVVGPARGDPNRLAISALHVGTQAP